MQLGGLVLSLFRLNPQQALLCVDSSMPGAFPRKPWASLSGTASPSPACVPPRGSLSTWMTVVGEPGARLPPQGAQLEGCCLAGKGWQQDPDA